ncbi:hypothetical protein OS175_11110 [Marinicella sp. S1101]|uniref:hypothetical protein n=1 Tax=Marinicella marina TaxID=2996016 RepID=UPI002260FD71|nr:hypothetical protein [Marinicella marina]MCX7554432.1 hypothetical protein [Marinicella marina]MDJ1140583.1 hypothetical protein [Marinicella marina]
MNKVYSILFLLLTVPALCVAEDKPPQVISDAWTMIPKAGHEAKFEEALKAHLKFRHDNGDTRHWDTYRPVTGDSLNRYIVRSCCQPWAEQDSYRKWSNETLGNHFNENVHPHVEKYMHNFGEVDMDNSNWGEGVEANYVGVTYWNIKPGKGGQASDAIKQMSTLAKENDWPRSWSWSYPVGGDHRVMLATPFKNFADMAPMEENFYQFAMSHMKEKKVKEMFKNFNGSFSGSSYGIYRHDKSLSMHHDEKE